MFPYWSYSLRTDLRTQQQLRRPSCSGNRIKRRPWQIRLKPEIKPYDFRQDRKRSDIIIGFHVYDFPYWDKMHANNQRNRRHDELIISAYPQNRGHSKDGDIRNPHQHAHRFSDFSSPLGGITGKSPCVSHVFYTARNHDDRAEHGHSKNDPPYDSPGKAKPYGIKQRENSHADRCRRYPSGDFPKFPGISLVFSIGHNVCLPFAYISIRHDSNMTAP